MDYEVGNGSGDSEKVTLLAATLDHQVFVCLEESQRGWAETRRRWNVSAITNQVALFQLAPPPDACADTVKDEVATQFCDVAIFLLCIDESNLGKSTPVGPVSIRPVGGLILLHGVYNHFVLHGQTDRQTRVHLLHSTSQCSQAPRGEIVKMLFHISNRN